MKEKLESILSLFEDINNKLTRPEVLADQEQMIKLSRERTHLEPIVEKIREYLDLYKNITSAEEML
ncbi:MAG: PCRF domain-containing protein, partial [Candidatus Muiribacteriaceae bacterium]